MQMFLSCEYSQVLSLPREELILIVWGWPQPFGVHRFRLPGVFSWGPHTLNRGNKTTDDGYNGIDPNSLGWEKSDTRQGTIVNKIKMVPWYGMCCGLKKKYSSVLRPSVRRHGHNHSLMTRFSKCGCGNTKWTWWRMRYSPDRVISFCHLPAGLMLLRGNHGG